ncbi:MAG: SRPBCC family protein [Hellea sp.]|nr:SRPBCC family protein [Hellea sp.]
MTENYGKLLEDGSLKFERLLPGPISRVWDWFASGEERARWLCGGGTAAKAGQTIKFDFLHSKLTPHDEAYPEAYEEMESGVSFDVEIMTCDSPSHLVWFWPSPDSSDVIVDVRLREDGDQVRLILIQRGEVTPDHLISTSAGWHVHLDIMAAKMNSDVPWPFWTAHEEKVLEYKKRFGL